METKDTVGKCKHCGDPIYKFQVVAHEGCTREFEFNPDYLDFQKGVDAGKTVGKQAGIKEVVEWGNEHCPHAGPPDDDPIQIKRHCNKCWQTQLKKWGTKNENCND